MHRPPQHIYICGFNSIMRRTQHTHSTSLYNTLVMNSGIYIGMDRRVYTVLLPTHTQTHNKHIQLRILTTLHNITIDCKRSYLIMCSNNKHKNQKHREYYAGTIAAVDDDEVEETACTHKKNRTRATTKHHPHMIAFRVAAACVNQISKTKNTATRTCCATTTTQQPQ